MLGVCEKKRLEKRICTSCFPEMSILWHLMPPFSSSDHCNEHYDTLCSQNGMPTGVQYIYVSGLCVGVAGFGCLVLEMRSFQIQPFLFSMQTCIDLLSALNMRCVRFYPMFAHNIYKHGYYCLIGFIKVLECYHLHVGLLWTTQNGLGTTSPCAALMRVLLTWVENFAIPGVQTGLYDDMVWSELGWGWLRTALFRRSEPNCLLVSLKVPNLAVGQECTYV